MRKLILLLFIPLVSFGQLTIETKYNPPEGFERIYNDGYSKFLRQFPLKNNNIVKYHYGEEKINNDIWDAVFDYDIGKHDLHQCADASIYLNARFKYDNNNLEEISYSFTSGYLFKYKNYLNGITPKPYQNSQRRWLVKEEQAEERVNNYETFFNYLEILWTWAGTLSVNNLDTKSIEIEEIQPGDIFIKGGSPGHSVTVVDVVKNNNNNKVLFMLAQSYMPAQENQILINPQNGSVWYTLDEFKDIITPQYLFTVNQLKRFKS
ncbi:DUF4846 domain-containing protein [Flavobacteriaceae bacterium]|nr:DUF4846 domain-containing protein [Flavobacteriaceae bacterium]